MRDIRHNPLIVYTIAIANMSKMIKSEIVSTDSPKIADIAVKYGAKVPFMRSSKFAQDESGHFERL